MDFLACLCCWTVLSKFVFVIEPVFQLLPHLHLHLALNLCYTSLDRIGSLGCTNTINVTLSVKYN